MTEKSCSRCGLLINKATHKHCVKCGEHKPNTLENWHFKNGKPANGWCKPCRQAKLRENYAKLDPELKRERRRASRNRNREAYLRKKREDARVRNANLTDKQIARRRELGLKRYHSDKLRWSISCSINKALKSKGLRKRNKPFLEFVDWDMIELKAHLSELFEDGMSFENYGDWHLDHIIPVVSVECGSADDPLFRRLWALKNLAPLWKSENCSKKRELKWQLPETYKNPKLRAMYENPDPVLLEVAIQ